MVFLGTHTPRLDEKGRLFLPARFREPLADGLVVTRARSAASTSSRPTSSTGSPSRCAAPGAVRHRARLHAASSWAGATTRSPTSRAASPSPRACAVRRAGPRVTVIGAGTRFEIWDAAAWDAYLGRAEPAYSASSRTEEVVPGPLLRPAPPARRLPGSTAPGPSRPPVPRPPPPRRATRTPASSRPDTLTRLPPPAGPGRMGTSRRAHRTRPHPPHRPARHRHAHHRHTRTVREAGR